MKALLSKVQKQLSYYTIILTTNTVDTKTILSKVQKAVKHSTYVAQYQPLSTILFRASNTKATTGLTASIIPIL